MEELLKTLMEGIDPDDPGATMKLFWRMMGLIDWWSLFWLTVVFTVVGGLIGRFKGETLKGLVLGATLGPIGWVVSLLSKSKRLACPVCLRSNAPAAATCRHCGVKLHPDAVIAPK